MLYTVWTGGVVMSKRLDNSAVPIEKRQDLITALPCFAMLSKDESRELANLMTVTEYLPKEVIVTEEAIVDSVFIIVSGQAEVTKQASQKNKITRRVKISQVPVALLEAGEAIGLNDTGFFSETGKRTATVTAVSETRVLSLAIKELHEFLQAHPNLQPAMFAASYEMLKITLIKKSLAFNKLSHERLKWLANKVEEVSYSKGAVIFNQGDAGDRCYLIRSGQVEIVSNDHQLAVLKTPTLFGEATLVTRSPRNATARALEDCQLLMLRFEYLSELLESENNVAEMVMTLMVDRSRPLQNPKIEIHEQNAEDGQEIVILKNPETGNYFKLSQEGWFIWEKMDGKHTLHEITLALAEKFGLFAPDVVAALISKLARSGFVEQVELGSSNIAIAKQPAWVRWMTKIRGILEARVTIGDTDKFLTKFYNKFAYLLFTKLGKLLLAFLAVGGIVAFFLSTSDVIDSFKTLPNTWLLLIILFPVTTFSVAFHEMGHALATKAFGHEVHYMGIGWYWLGPIAFTDTSDMWLSTRWPRVMVNLAGAYTDVMTAGVAAIVIFLISNPYLQAFLWLFALFTYINAFRMMSPLQEWDGYYVLMDLLDRPRLRQSAVLWLIKDFPKAIKNPKLFKKHIPEVCYWVYCIIFLVLVSLMTLMVQGFLFKILGLHSPNMIVSLSIPFLVVAMSCLGIMAELRNKD